MPFQAKFDIGSTSDAESVAGNGSIIALLKRLRTLLGTLLTEGLTVSGSVGVVSVALPSAVYSGQKTVTSHGTAEALGAAQAITGVLYVKALSTNTGNAYLGGASVDSSNGWILSAGEISPPILVDNVSKIFIDVDVDGDGVCWFAS